MLRTRNALPEHGTLQPEPPRCSAEIAVDREGSIGSYLSSRASRRSRFRAVAARGIDVIATALCRLGHTRAEALGEIGSDEAAASLTSVAFAASIANLGCGCRFCRRLVDLVCCGQAPPQALFHNVRLDVSFACLRDFVHGS